MAAATALRSQLEVIAGSPLALRERAAPEFLPAGIAGLEFPRGCLTEIVGPASSGRTSLLLSFLAEATCREEVCAIVDAGDALDPASAAAAGVDLARLLWVRCGGDAERALKAVDLLVQAGGFGVIVMDLGDVPPRTARRISLTSWYRLRRAVEHTPTALVVLGQEPQAKSCASLVLECARGEPVWSGKLLRGLRFHAERRKPAGPRVKYVCVHPCVGN